MNADHDANISLNVKLHTLLSKTGNSPADIGLSSAKYCKYPSQYEAYGGDIEEFDKPWKGIWNRRYQINQKLSTENIQFREKNEYDDSPDYQSPILKWEQENYDKTKKHPDFICALGILKTLMCMPTSYSRQYSITARKEPLGDGETIFLYFNSEWSSDYISLSGYGLERLLLSETPDGEPTGNDKQYNLSNELLGVFHTDISTSNNKSYRLHYTAVLDGLWTGKDINEYTSQDITEVKSIGHDAFASGESSSISTFAKHSQHASFGRTWAHCTLLGADKVMYGLLDAREHTLKELRMYEVLEIPNLRGLDKVWAPQKLLNHLNMELRHISDTMETKVQHSFHYDIDKSGNVREIQLGGVTLFPSE